MSWLTGGARQTDDAGDARAWEDVEEAIELLHEGRFIEAIVELRRVLKEDKRNAYAFRFLGTALYESGELEAARDAYKASLALAPRYLGARIDLSHTLRGLQDLRGALEQGEIARRQEPEDPDVWHALGMAHADNGDEDLARRLLEAFLRSNPELEVSLEVRAALERLGPAPEIAEEDDDDVLN
jgi:Flp pilus assembly protein TadD